MTFEKALEAMRQGKKVRRKEWNNGEYAHIVNGCFMNEKSNCLELTLNDCNIDDWEIYEEPNKEETKISNVEILHGVNVIRYILKFPSNKQALAELDVPISHAFEIMKIAEKEAEKSIKSDPIYKYCKMGNELNSDNETKMTAGHAIEVLESIRQVTSKSVIPDVDEVIDFAIKTLENQNQQELVFDPENLSQKELEKLQEKLKECKLEVNPEKKCECERKCNHTVEDADLQVKMEQALSRTFFELADTTTDSLAVSNMLDIYRLLFEVQP